MEIIKVRKNRRPFKGNVGAIVKRNSNANSPSFLNEIKNVVASTVPTDESALSMLTEDEFQHEAGARNISFTEPRK
jgi:hypothetical protein